MVDFYYVLNGTRGMMAAAASAVVLLVAWGATGAVYGALLGDGATGQASLLSGGRRARHTLPDEPASSAVPP